MRDVPFTGRLDVTLACLLVVERHGSVASRAVGRGELASDVMSLIAELDLPPECLSDVDAFDAEVDRALEQLVRAGWVGQRRRLGGTAYRAEEVAEDVVLWIRSRFQKQAREVAAFDRLDRAVTQRVLSDYGAGAPAPRPPSRS